MTNHSFTCPLIRIIIASSDRNNPDRSIPTRTTVRAGVGIEAKFQSYQSKQINPDLVQRLPKEWRLYMVSIVSIQTDQSRPVRNLPDLQNTDSFQSYQSKQINPDLLEICRICKIQTRFNRINPDRSIPTCSPIIVGKMLLMFQSYQFRQINPDNKNFLFQR